MFLRTSSVFLILAATCVALADDDVESYVRHGETRVPTQLLEGPDGKLVKELASGTKVSLLGLTPDARFWFVRAGKTTGFVTGWNVDVEPWPGETLMIMPKKGGYELTWREGDDGPRQRVTVEKANLSPDASRAGVINGSDLKNVETVRYGSPRSSSAVELFSRPDRSTFKKVVDNWFDVLGRSTDGRFLFVKTGRGDTGWVDAEYVSIHPGDGKRVLMRDQVVVTNSRSDVKSKFYELQVAGESGRIRVPEKEIVDNHVRVPQLSAKKFTGPFDRTRTGTAAMANADLTVRATPGGGKEVATLDDGETFDVFGLSKDGDWYAVRTARGKYGWVPVKATLVAPSSDQDGVPIRVVTTRNGYTVTVGDDSPKQFANDLLAAPVTPSRAIDRGFQRGKETGIIDALERERAKGDRAEER